MKALVGITVCLALVTFATFAQAQSDPGLVGSGDWSGPLEIRFPDPPVENVPITIQVPSDGCYAGGPRIDPELTTIVRDGSQVTIDFHAYLMACFSVGGLPTVWVYNQDLGSFAAGDYAIAASYHYIEEPTAPPFAVLNATMQVAHGSTAAFALPAISAAAAFLLVVALALIGSTRARRCRLPI